MLLLAQLPRAAIRVHSLKVAVSVILTTWHLAAEDNVHPVEENVRARLTTWHLIAEDDVHPVEVDVGVRSPSRTPLFKLRWLPQGQLTHLRPMWYSY